MPTYPEVQPPLVPLTVAVPSMSPGVAPEGPIGARTTKIALVPKTAVKPLRIVIFTGPPIDLG